jgi:hypothetical protein
MLHRDVPDFPRNAYRAGTDSAKTWADNRFGHSPFSRRSDG